MYIVPFLTINCYKVEPPVVPAASVNIYTQYVAQVDGNFTVQEDKYEAYVNCKLDVFPVVGWED